MVFSNSDNAETINCDFNLNDLEEPVVREGGGHLKNFSDKNEHNGGRVNAVKVVEKNFKEGVNQLAKSTKKKTQEELAIHQNLVVQLVRYGSSKRFADYLKSLDFNLSASQIKKLETRIRRITF